VIDELETKVNKTEIKGNIKPQLIGVQYFIFTYCLSSIISLYGTIVGLFAGGSF